MLSMRYLFNLAMGTKTIADPEGAEFIRLEEARREAKQIAREVAAQELRQGRAVGSDWKVEVTDRFGNVQATISFEFVILASRPRLAHSGPAAEDVTATAADKHFIKHYYRAQALFEETRGIAANLKATFEEMRGRLAQL
jgi:hypothetical protein